MRRNVSISIRSLVAVSRRACSTAIRRTDDRTRGRSHRRAERRRAPAWVLAYDGLTDRSLVLAGISARGRGRQVVLVLEEIGPGAAFAGVRTAIAVAAGLASRTGRALRIVTTGASPLGGSARATARFVAERFASALPADLPPVEVVPREDLGSATFAVDTIWIATYWRTAHALDVAARAGVIDRERVVYLVQDHEPGFLSWSAASAAASATYRAGFLLCVNSTPVATALERHEGVSVDPRLVFAPELDLAGTKRAAAVRAERGEDVVVRVVFYGRPGKPRNMFPLGVAALRVAARELDGAGLRLEFLSAGETHPDVDLGGGHMLRSVGTLSWDGWFDLLGTADVVLSLQQSPHPSHPPLDAAVSGARVVTNELGGLRSGLHPKLVAVDADPTELGSAVADAVRTRGHRGSEPTASAGTPLGRPLPTVVDELARLLCQDDGTENGCPGGATARG